MKISDLSIIFTSKLGKTLKKLRRSFMSWKLAGRDYLQKCAKFALQRNLLNCLSAEARRALMKKRSICS